MRPFAALERFFERLFERPSARLFHARLQPIQLQRRVERAMENGRLSAADRVVVPNRYLVRMAPADLQAFGDFADSLELELADAALRFARAHRYAVSDRPAVRLHEDPTVDPGDVRVDATFSDAPPSEPEFSVFPSPIPPPPDVPMAPSPAIDPAGAVGAVGSIGPNRADIVAERQPIATPRPAALQGDGPPPRPLAPPGEPADGAASMGIRSDGHPRGVDAEPVARTPWAPAPPPAPNPPTAPPVAPSRQPMPPPVDARPRRVQQAGLDRLDVTRTMIFEVPTPDAPVVVLREVLPDGSQRQLTLDGGPVTIGRASDNILVLNDSRVSRYHGRLAPRQGALVYRDLGSTNGSRVNGVEIDEVVLGAGDRIEVGDTVLVVESVVGG